MPSGWGFRTQGVCTSAWRRRFLLRPVLHQIQATLVELHELLRGALQPLNSLLRGWSLRDRILPREAGLRLLQSPSDRREMWGREPSVDIGTSDHPQWVSGSVDGYGQQAGRRLHLIGSPELRRSGQVRLNDAGLIRRSSCKFPMHDRWLRVQTQAKAVVGVEMRDGVVGGITVPTDRYETPASFARRFDIEVRLAELNSFLCGRLACSDLRRIASSDNLSERVSEKIRCMRIGKSSLTASLSGSTPDASQR